MCRFLGVTSLALPAGPPPQSSDRAWAVHQTLDLQEKVGRVGNAPGQRFNSGRRTEEQHLPETAAAGV